MFSIRIIPNVIFSNLLIKFSDFFDFICIKTFRYFVNDKIKASDDFIKYTLLIEDKRFFLHNGFDAFSILRSFIFNQIQGTKLQGGTTITEQIIKIENKLKERSIKNRIKKTKEAIKREIKRNKIEILSDYLSIVKFGKRSQGISSASMKYFNKKPTDLNQWESFFLAERICQPNSCNPKRIISLLKRKWIRYGIEDDYLNLFEIYGEVFGEKYQNQITYLFIKQKCFEKKYGPTIKNIKFISTIRQIKTGEWIGGMISSESIKLIKSLGIKCIISLSEIDNETKKTIDKMKINHISAKITGMINDNQIYEIIEKTKEFEPQNVFIHCTHGAHRSAAVACLLMSQLHKFEFIESFFYFASPKILNIFNLFFLLQEQGIEIKKINLSNLSIYSLNKKYGFLASNEKYIKFIKSIVETHKKMSLAMEKMNQSIPIATEGRND